MDPFIKAYVVRGTFSENLSCRSVPILRLWRWLDLHHWPIDLCLGEIWSPNNDVDISHVPRLRR